MTEWLIVSYFANVDALAPSHHIDGRIPLFIRKGIVPRLLSSPCGSAHAGLMHRRVPSPAPSGIRYEVRHLLRRKTTSRFWFKFWETAILLPVLPFYFIEKLLLRLDSTWSWCITASVAATLMAVRYRPAVIYSTGGPVSGHLAAMAASRLTGIPHIAEFQDPLVHDRAAPGRLERRFIEGIEGRLARTAGALVFLTKKAAEGARIRNPLCRQITAIYAGSVPPAGTAVYRRTGACCLAHFGSLDGSRNLDHILPALDMLIAGDGGAPSILRLELFGATGKRVRNRIGEFGHKEIITVRGKVGRDESLRGMASADVLLLIQNTDEVSFETIPSKVYEYLQTGRPILGLVYRNPELREMLERNGHVAVEADDAAAIKQGIAAYLSMWKEDRLPRPRPDSRFTVDEAVDGLMGLAEGLAGRSVA